MKKFETPTYGQETDRIMVIYLPKTEWGQKSCIGVQLNGFFTNEGEFDPTSSTITIEHLYGCAPTWTDVFAALYWGPDEETALGEQLEGWGAQAHAAREKAWRLEERHFGRWTEWLIREKPCKEHDHYGLKGRISARITITPAGKIDGKITLSLADWYVFMKGIPSPTWDKVVEMYEGNPPRETTPYEGGWSEPGEEPREFAL